MVLTVVVFPELVIPTKPLLVLARTKFTKFCHLYPLEVARVVHFVYLLRSMYQHPVETRADSSETRVPSQSFSTSSIWLLLIAAAGIPIGLLWDFSWESTVGVDLFWSPPHVATYVAVLLGGLVAARLIRPAAATSVSNYGARLGRFQAPLGAWVILWGAAAFLTSVAFDRWWQSAYGLGAGIWHPPQILKGIAFFAVAIGVWLVSLHRQNNSGQNRRPVAFVAAGGLLLSLITVVTLTTIYPNRQHSAFFYKLICATYPVVLVALAHAAKCSFPATIGAIVYMAVICSTTWLLPLFPAKPQTAPIYNAMDHLMPPPFALLLIGPAVVLDLIWRKGSRTKTPFAPWLQAGAAGLAFFIVIYALQWVFAEFLLTQLADNWFFAGGGTHWPFFLKIDPAARQLFWETGQDEMNFLGMLISSGLAIGAASLGLLLGSWMKRVQR